MSMTVSDIEAGHARMALQAIRGLALTVVGASETYGETESAHLWQEIADMADRGLAAQEPPDTATPSEPLLPWEENRDRWMKKGYNIHAYHGFKAGPLPGCNASYGPGFPCSGSIDEHCHCGSGDHLRIPDTAAPAAGQGASE